MSVVGQNTQGWVLDACSLTDQSYSRCIRLKDNQKSLVTCRFKRQCFQILQSHYSVSASAAVDGANTDMVQKPDKPSKVKPKAAAARGSLQQQLLVLWLYSAVPRIWSSKQKLSFTTAVGLGRWSPGPSCHFYLKTQIQHKHFPFSISKTNKIYIILKYTVNILSMCCES